MNFKKFDFLLSELLQKNILITTHDQVDLDGVASCVLLKYFLETYLKTIEIHLFFSQLSNYTINFLNNLNNLNPDLHIWNSLDENEENYSNIDFLIILDTNNLNQVVLPENLSVEIPHIFIDHHFESDKHSKDNRITDNIIIDDFTSTAEIIIQFFKHYQIEIPNKFRYLLLAAIYTDTGGFKYAINETFHIISEILDEKIDYQKFLTQIEKKNDFSKKMAIIKGLQRVEVIRIKDILIGLTHVSSFTSSVASKLLQIGFDISIVYSKLPSSYRITTRAKKDVCLKTGLHLGKILSEIKEGSGGGHDGAASLNGENSFEPTLNQIILKIKKTLNNI